MRLKYVTFNFPGGTQGDAPVHKELAECLAEEYRKGWMTVESESGYSHHGPHETRLIFAPRREFLEERIRELESMLAACRKELARAPEVT